MAVIGLVHGAWHGSWCFAGLAAELRERGHRPVLVDLPIEDVTAGAARYAEVITRALDHVTGEVVVLGHSMAGLALPLVPALRPVRQLVFLCALLPRPGRALAPDPATARGRPSADLLVDADGTTRWTGDAVLEVLYGQCAPAVARSAAARLRPQAARPLTEVTPLAGWPDVECTAIYGTNDLMVPPELFVPVARALLGREPSIIESDHSPFLSRTTELAALVHRVLGVGGNDR